MEEGGVNLIPPPVVFRNMYLLRPGRIFNIIISHIFFENLIEI